MIWTPYDGLNKAYSFYMAAVVVIGDECGFRIEACCNNQLNRSKPLLYIHYFHFSIPFKQLYTSY